MADRAAEGPCHERQRALGPDVGDRVRPAVGHALTGLLRLVRRVGACRVALERVAQDVQARRGRHRRRLGERQLGVDDSQDRAQPRVRDAGLHVLVDDVEHADGGALAAGPRGRGHGHEWQERLARGTALPDRRVDVVHQLAVVREQERDGLGGVDAAAAADRQDGVDGAGVAGEGDRVLETAVGRLDPGAVEDDDVEAVGGQAVGDLGRGIGPSKIIGVGEQGFAPARPRRHDARFACGDARRALAAEFERLVILDRRFGAVEPAIGLLAADILGEAADGRIGTHPGLLGKAFRTGDIGFDDLRSRRLGALAEELVERRCGLRSSIRGGKRAGGGT